MFFKKILFTYKKEKLKPKNKNENKSFKEIIKYKIWILFKYLNNIETKFAFKVFIFFFFFLIYILLDFISNYYFKYSYFFKYSIII